MSHNAQPTAPQAMINHFQGMMVTPENVVDPNWYMDSGASSHMTFDGSALHNKTEYKGQGFEENIASRSAP
ncbi:hypothetical protein Syun_002024 [Stephania yunnanensis]|uniref:Uncharacterized protein n=1 Tax=Stephania yunnanensis TaxID=152371 RepID=A0AAP0Q8D7_9MAGN